MSLTKEIFGELQKMMLDQNLELAAGLSSIIAGKNDNDLKSVVILEKKSKESKKCEKILKLGGRENKINYNFSNVREGVLADDFESKSDDEDDFTVSIGR